MAYSNKPHLLAPFIAVLSFHNPAWAACLVGEDAFMSCTIQGSGESLRVCFTPTDVHYRFGGPKQTPDLALSVPVAQVDYTPWPGVGRSIAEVVSFTNQGYTYDVYAGFERMFGDEEYDDIEFRHFGGVRVFNGETLARELACERQTVEFTWGEGLFTAKNNLGYVWDFDSRTWVELPD